MLSTRTFIASAIVALVATFASSTRAAAQAAASRPAFPPGPSAATYPPGPSTRAYPPGPSAPGASATVLGGQPPKVYYACYVPSSGVTYRIKEVDIKQTCSTDHVMFSWTDGGTPGPQGPKGDPGPQGPQGVPGTSGAFDIQAVLGDVVDLPPGYDVDAFAVCPAGTKVIGGGFYLSPTFSPAPGLIKSRADMAYNRWAVELLNTAPNAHAQSVYAYAYCIK